jgi:WD40 repeat protein
MNADDFSIDDEALRDFMPTSFGKQARTANIQAQFDLSKRKVVDESKPPAVKSSHSEKDKDSEASSDDDDDDDSEEEDEFPVSHELLIKTHDRAVTTASLDASGSRLVTGSNDCLLKFHDFAAMTPTTVRAFKSVDPSATKSSANSETHPIHQVLFNPHYANQILVITAQPQAKIFSRDGEQLIEFIKGDPYLRDMHNTKGHISEITCGAWHPTNRDIFVTGGTDSTVRIWNTNDRREQKHVIVHRSRAAGSAGRTRITAIAWGVQAQGGNSLLIAASLDGSLVMWIGEGPYHRPAGEIRDAHEPNTWTGGLDISADGRLVVTRGGDDTIKLWDTRNFKAPMATVSHPSTSGQYPTSNIRFSPDSASIITGSATGHLHIFSAGLRPELVTPVTLGSPLISVLWHAKLNQIITGSANAEMHILFNPNLSNGGAKLVMSKAPKRRHIDDDSNLTMDLSEGISGDSIITPGGMPGTNTSATSFSARHPTVGLTASGKSRDPRRPHVPATTPFAKTNPDEKHIRDHIPLSSMRDEDPREALLKYADKAKNDPLFTNAWKHTQPVTLYGELSDEEKEPEAKKVKR